MPDVTSPTNERSVSEPHPFPTTDAAALVEAKAQLDANVEAASRPTSVPTSAPTSEPTSQPESTFDAAKGDVFVSVAHAIDNVGLKETVYQTPFTGWLIFAFGLCAGVVVGRLVGALLSRAGARAAEKVRLTRAVLINSFAGPISLLLFLIGFGFGLAFLTLSMPLHNFLIAAFQVMNLVWIGWLLYNLIDLVTIVLGRWARGRQGNLSIMLVPLARKTLRIALITVLVLFAAENIFQYDVRTLLTTLGIAGLAVSLAAQDTLRNLFGSIMIFADQPFAIGDNVKITDIEGCVEDIGFRSTRLRTADGFVASIPNGNIASAAVLNYSRRKSIRRAFDVALPADGDPSKTERALQALRDVLADPEIVAGFNREHPPTVLFDDPNQRKARVTYWFRSKDTQAYAAHAEKLNLKIVERFHAANVDVK